METKKEFRYYTIMEYEKEQLYLQKRHKEGWKFIKVTGLGMYHFEKCEPEDMVYQLDYNQEGREHKEEYIQMFKDCGWEYIMDFVGYSYFRKPACEMKENEGIFCDDESRLEMVQRIFNGRIIPLIAIFFAIIVPQLIAQIGLKEYAAAAVFGVLFIVYLLIFASYVKKFMEYKKQIEK